MQTQFVSRRIVALVGIGVFGASLLLGMYFRAEAAISSNVSASLVSAFNASIMASSSGVAVIGLNLASNAEMLASTSVAILASNGFATSTDLAPFSTGTSSGIALYKDNKTTGVSGMFDAADIVLPLAVPATMVGATTTLTLAVAEPVPVDDTTGTNVGNDYFIVIRTAPTATNGHTATFALYPGNVGYAGGSTPSATPIALMTSALTVDTVAPSLVSSGPTSGATGVPISSFINATLSSTGDMDFSTMKGSNITLTTGGSPVGVSINTNPNGFNVVISNPPTYATGALFAKVANPLFGFFMVNSGQPLFPQGGSYATPAMGDIVYFQHDTFPPELGVVTNATMTGGTFAINDFTLMGGQGITRFKAPDVTGLVSAATALHVGDLVVTNTTANPTGMRYSWHIVTTLAAMNSASLRLDGASAAPTYASTTMTRFSSIVPTATTTVNGSSQLASTTVFMAGDMVFANVTANADNLNAYGWHVVTTGETITSGAAASALRLDNGAAVPTIAPSSVIALLTPGAQGLGTETATTFSFGDIVLTKTTANSGTNGAYAFHIVSSGNDGAGGAASTNLRFDNSSANLATGSSYTLTIGTGVKDRAGNPLASAAVITFSTGSTGSTNSTPPFVQSSLPQPGNQQFPTTAPLAATFSVDMATSGGGDVTNSANVGLYVSNFGALGTQIATTNTYDATTKTVALAHAALSLSTEYILVVKTTTQSATNVALGQEYRAFFKTAAATDTTAPTVMGAYPATGATGVSRSVIIGAGFSEDMDASTVNSSTIRLTKTSDGSPVAGTVAYNPQGRGVSFAPSAQLLASTGYTFTASSTSNGVKDLAGNALAANYTATFTTDNVTDTTLPAISFSNADNFGVAVTFSEPLKTGGGPNAADNIANFTLESPVGSSIALGGKTVTYDAMSKTAKISGLSLQNGNAFKVTVSTQVQDLAGNGLDSTGTPAKNTAFGTVADATLTGGLLGPGTGPAPDAGMQGMNPTRVSPMSRAAGATSNYKVEFLAATSIPLGSQIVLTFPAGFDVTNATTSATTASFCNADMNGPMTGVVGIAGAARDTAAGTITVTTSGAATGANAFLCFDLTGIVNSTIPSATGYTVDIKTRDAGNNLSVLETKTSAPFFLGQTGNGSLNVQVFHDDNSNGVRNGGEAISGVTVFFFSPASGGQSAVTDAAGDVAFTGLTSGDYQVGLQPSSASAYVFNSAPQLITISGSTTKQFILTAAPRTITGTVYGPANTKLDVFAGSPNGFAKTTVTTNSTPVVVNSVSYGGSVAYSLGVQNNTTYQVGVGPSIPEGSMIPGAPPPPPPTFNFMPPQSLTVPIVTTNVAGRDFMLTAAANSITGTVKDSANAAVSNAGVFCRPVGTDSFGTGIGAGTGGQTGTAGTFTLATVPGVYLCGVFKPGMPSVQDKQVTIASDGTQTPTTLAFTLDAGGSSLTITGTIKDDGGNAVPYAGVGARKVTSTSDTSPLGGDSSNFVGGPADSNGAYTLYVTAGTWVIEAFAPGVGRLGTKTVTVSTASLSGQDFSAATLNLGSITGSSTQAGIGVQGVMIRADNADGTSGNMAPSAADGSYSLKVPAGTYTVRCFFPGIGEAAPLTNVVVTSSTATGDQTCSIAAPITVTVRVTDGTNPIQNAFVDVRDTNGRGNGTNVSTTTGIYGVYVLTVPPGTYSVRIGHPAYGPIGAAQTITSAANLTATSTGSSMVAVTGTVTGDGNALSGAWVSLTGTPTGQTNLINVGGQSGTSGAFSISVPAGSYSIRANKPGYQSPAPTTVTVSGATAAGTIALTTAARTISGSVTLSGSAVSGAFVDANDGSGGFAVAQTDSSGAYSLPVSNGTWTLHARSQGYESSTVNVVVSGSNQTQTLTLSAISGFTVKPERQENVTPTAGGNLTNTDIGSSFKLNIPANALGTSANAGTVTTKANTAVPTPASGTVLAKNAVSISASDSSGQPIKTLNDNATIVVPYTEGDIPSGLTEANLVLGVWNDATQAYDTLSTTVDTANNTLTAIVSHFSDFAPLLSSNTSNAVATPAAATPAASSGGGGGGSGGSSGLVAIAPVVATPVVTTSAAVTSSAAPASATPVVVSSYARVITLGAKGDDVSALQTFLEGKGFLVMPQGVAKGYFGQLTKKALAAYQTSVGLPAVGIFGPLTKAKVEGALAVKASTSSASPQYARTLALGLSGDDVATLQTFLEDKGFLVMPQGIAKGYFGLLTKKAVAAYQESIGLPGVGAVGPQTRAHLNALPE